MRILIIGGYGHFGTKICRALASEDNIHIAVAGRNLEKANQLIENLKPPVLAKLSGVTLDIFSDTFALELASLAPDLVLHTCGPYQSQDYRVAEACISIGAHYIDLADGRDFVCGISRLDTAAQDANVLVTSGASTLPAVSSAVIDSLKDGFAMLREIRISIAPGQDTPRGVATLQAVLSYCGKPFRRLQNGEWRTVYGWQAIHRFRYPELGTRWLAACDVPDLELFPGRYNGVKTVTFDAALELAVTQWGLWSMALIRRLGLVRDWSKYANMAYRAASVMDRLGGDSGGMHIGLKGIDSNGVQKQVDFNLVARQAHGPEIPVIPACVVAKKLARGALDVRGAKPCVDLMTFQEFERAVAHLDIEWAVAES